MNSCVQRYAEHLGRLGYCEPRKEPELDQLRAERRFLGQPGQDFIQSQKVDGRHLGGELVRIGVHSLPVAAVFETLLAASIVDEDAAHGLGSRREEVPSPLPVPSFVAADQPQVSLMDEGRGVERLPRRFVGELVPCQSAQLLIDERQKPAGGLRVALIDGAQQVGDITHYLQG